MVRTVQIYPGMISFFVPVDATVKEMEKFKSNCALWERIAAKSDGRYTLLYTSRLNSPGWSERMDVIFNLI